LKKDWLVSCACPCAEQLNERNRNPRNPVGWAVISPSKSRNLEWFFNLNFCWFFNSTTDRTLSLYITILAFTKRNH
jgi:hypothetical protein